MNRLLVVICCLWLAACGPTGVVDKTTSMKVNDGRIRVVSYQGFHVSGSADTTEVLVIEDSITHNQYVAIHGYGIQQLDIVCNGKTCNEVER